MLYFRTKSYTFVKKLTIREQKIKIIHPLAVCAIALLVLAPSCKEKKESTVIIAPKPVEQKPSEPNRMQDADNSTDVEWLGKTYHVNVVRKTDTSLPLTKDEGDHPYYDSRITLTIKRSDGSEFFRREFLKTDFARLLPDDMKCDGALLGIVFDRVEGNRLVFAASVGSPDVLSDAFLPIVLTVSNMGDVDMQRDLQLDSGQLPEEKPDDDGV